MHAHIHSVPYAAAAAAAVAAAAGAGGAAAAVDAAACKQAERSRLLRSPQPQQSFPKHSDMLVSLLMLSSPHSKDSFRHAWAGTLPALVGLVLNEASNVDM